jgi:cysteine synthase B
MTAPVRGAILDLVGNTPLIRLRALDRDFPGVEIWAKAEFQNPSGSVKDRAAAAMILGGERDGALTRGKTIIDATSGNTGIAYAAIGAALGYRVALCMPDKGSSERRKILRAHGAETILTDPLEGGDGAIREARRIAASDPNRYFYPDQYNNDRNWRAHFETTGPEILTQTGGSLTHFVAAVGTSGTFVGTGRFLRERKPSVRLIAVHPDSSFHGIEGLKHLESSLVPGIWDAALPDQRLSVTTEAAYAATRRLAREEGLLVGVSSGANVSAALRVADRIGSGMIVTILADSGLRYLSERFWEDTTTEVAKASSEIMVEG